MCVHLFLCLVSVVPPGCKLHESRHASHQEGPEYITECWPRDMCLPACLLASYAAGNTSFCTLRPAWIQEALQSQLLLDPWVPLWAKPLLEVPSRKQLPFISYPFHPKDLLFQWRTCFCLFPQACPATFGIGNLPCEAQSKACKEQPPYVFGLRQSLRRHLILNKWHSLLAANPHWPIWCIRLRSGTPNLQS